MKLGREQTSAKWLRPISGDFSIKATRDQCPCQEFACIVCWRTALYRFWTTYGRLRKAKSEPAQAMKRSGFGFTSDDWTNMRVVLIFVRLLLVSRFPYTPTA